MRQAILDVVRRVMARVADEGLPGEHHFYLTFATGAEGVEMPPRQRQQFPDEMTIVLQHQFWNLAVDEAGFGVTLRFSGRPERVRVPWTALRVFADPSVGFALKLPSNEAAALADHAPDSQPGGRRRGHAAARPGWRRPRSGAALRLRRPASRPRSALNAPGPSGRMRRPAMARSSSSARSAAGPESETER